MQFWFRFSVDFSPLFGLRAFGKLLVLLCFSSSGVDLWTVFGPIFGVLFIIRGFVSLVGNVVFQVYVGFMCLVRMVGWVSSVRGHMCLAGLV